MYGVMIVAVEVIIIASGGTMGQASTFNKFRLHHYTGLGMLETLQESTSAIGST